MPSRNACQKAERTKALTVLSTYFDKPEVLEDPVIFEVYEQGLSKFTSEELKASVSRALAECKFMPKLAELLEFAGAQPKQAIATLQDELKLRAEREWDALLSGVGEDINMATGAVFVAHPPLSDAGMYALRQVGGARAVLAVQEEDDSNKTHWARRNFIEAYARYAETGGLKALPQSEAKRLLAGVTKGLLPKGE